MGFHLPSWNSRFVSLSKVVADFLKGLEDPRKMMVWVTQHCAKPWLDVVENKEEAQVLEHVTDLPAGVVPGEAIALTAGIDVQKTGFWFVVRAWDEYLNSWLIQYGFLSSFTDVEALLFKTRYPVKDSREKMGIFRAAMDTGGGKSESDDWSRTEEIYQWIREKGRGVCFAIKGASRRQERRVNPRVIDRMTNGKKLPGGLTLYFLDTEQFKDVIHFRLDRKEGDRQQFFLHEETGQDYARQLLAEVKVKDKKGRMFWQARRRDNHLLDCEVYAAAAADMQWAPSMVRLHNSAVARKEAMKNEPEKKKEAGEDQRGSGVKNFNRPGWLDR